MKERITRAPQQQRGSSVDGRDTPQVRAVLLALGVLVEELGGLAGKAVTLVGLMLNPKARKDKVVEARHELISIIAVRRDTTSDGSGTGSRRDGKHTRPGGGAL